jgi:hypothetical protein
MVSDTMSKPSRYLQGCGRDDDTTYQLYLGAPGSPTLWKGLLNATGSAKCIREQCCSSLAPSGDDQIDA